MNSEKHTGKQTGFIRELRNLFLTGLLVLSPLVITIWITVQIFLFTDGFLGRPIRFFLSDIVKVEFFEERTIHGIGLIALLLVVLLTGWLARQYFGIQIVKTISGFFAHIPLVNKVYSAVVQIAEALLGGRKDVFKTAVLIEFPKKDVFSVAFITQDTRGPVQEALHKDVVSVFVPTTPNPTSGYLLFIPKEEIIPLDVSVEEALKLIISAGAIIPRRDGADVDSITLSQSGTD